MDEDDERRPAMQDGHKYDAPESADDRRSKSYDYAVLGALVVILMVLVATGIVPIFDI